MTICCCSCRGRWPHPLLMVVLSVLSLVIGIVIICETPLMVTTFVNSQLELTTPGSSLFAPFQNPGSPMQGPKMNVKISIYGLHCLNAEDVIAKGAIPQMKQVGPYVYNVSRYKHPIAWEDDDKRISYRYHTVFNFDANSSLENDDNITQYTFVNPGIGGALIRLENPQYATILGTVNSWITNTSATPTPNDGLFTKRSIKEITFGYLSPVLSAAKTMHDSLPFLVPDVPTTYPAVIVNDTSLTTTADTTQLTGKEKIQDILKVVKWAGYENLPWWGAGRPQTFQGGDGTQFPPEMNVGDVHSAFLDILGRDIDLKVDEATTENDIPIKRLRIDPNSLKSATENPDNKGYNQFGPSGVWNLTAFPLSPVFNAPIYVSKPLFLDADPSYRQKVNLLDPTNQDIHDMRIDAVEHLGVPLRAHVRFQVNSLLWKVPGLDVTNNLTDSRVIPVVWVDLAEEPTQDMIDYLKGKLAMRRAGLVVGYVVGAFLILLAVVLVLVGVVSYFRRSNRSEGQRLLEVVDEQGRKKGHYVNI